MKKRELTPFGLAVKTKLLSLSHTQEWLFDEVNKETGLYIDSGYAYKIFTGERSAPKIIASICKILELDSPTDRAG